MKKIAVCGGHLTPALALIEDLQVKNDFEIIFFGRKFATEGSKNISAEYKIINSKRIKFIKITTGRLQRKFTKYTILSLFKVPIGFIQSTFYLLRYSPDVVISFGGYLSTPVVISASLIGIDSISHEQASAPGLATKINSIFSKKLFLTWVQTQKYFSREKTSVIGNLSRKSIYSKKPKNKDIENFIKNSKNLIVFTGGNQGSHFINSIVFKTIDDLKNFQIIHLVGTTNFKGDLDKAKKIKNKNYLYKDYVTSNDMSSILRSANIIVSRSGANTVWEIAVLKKCAIFIPLPFSSSQEQYHNAKILEQAGSAKVIEQKNVTEKRLKKEIEMFSKNLDAYQKNAIKFSSSLPKDAVSKIIKEIKKI